MPDDARAKQSAKRSGDAPPLLRRMDQGAVASLVLLALAGMGVYWFVHGGHRGELIVIDRAEPLTAQYVVDINAAPWPAAPRMKVLANLIFKASDLPEVPFDSRATPGVDYAERLLSEWLATGPRSYRTIMADGLRAGLSRTTFYKAKRRMGVLHQAGKWSLA